jgi:hypothetical protein
VLSLTIEALAAPPDWQVNAADFELTGSVTAQVLIDDDPHGDPGSLLAAFVGSELRGVAGPVEVLGSWLYFLTVYAEAPGEALTFQMHSSMADTVIDLDGTVGFESTMPIGSPEMPFLLRGSLPVATAVGELAVGQAPPQLQVFPAYPNPFNATVRLSWATTTAGRADVAVFDLLGRPVRRLATTGQAARALSWDGRDDAGRPLAAGVYFYVVSVAGQRSAGRVALVR